MQHNKRAIANFQPSPNCKEKDEKKISQLKYHKQENFQTLLIIPESNDNGHNKVHPNLFAPILHGEMKKDVSTKVFQKDNVSMKMTFTNGGYCSTVQNLNKNKIVSMNECCLHDKGSQLKREETYKDKRYVDEGHCQSGLNRRCWYIKRPVCEQNLLRPYWHCKLVENFTKEMMSRRLLCKMQDLSTLKDYTTKYSLPTNLDCDFSNLQNLFSEGLANSSLPREKSTKEKKKIKKDEKTKLQTDHPVKVGSKNTVRTEKGEVAKKSVMPNEKTQDIVSKNIVRTEKGVVAKKSVMPNEKTQDIVSKNIVRTEKGVVVNKSVVPNKITQDIVEKKLISKPDNQVKGTQQKEGLEFDLDFTISVEFEENDLIAGIVRAAVTDIVIAEIEEEKPSIGDNKDKSKQKAIVESKIDVQDVKNEVVININEEDRNEEIEMEESKIDSKKMIIEDAIKKKEIYKSDNEKEKEEEQIINEESTVHSRNVADHQEIIVEKKDLPEASDQISTQKELVVEPNIFVPVIHGKEADELQQDNFATPLIRTSIVKPLFSLPPNITPIISCEMPKLGYTDIVTLCLDSQIMLADTCQSTCKVPSILKDRIPVSPQNLDVSTKETLVQQKQYSPSTRPITKHVDRDLYSPAPTKDSKTPKGKSVLNITQIIGFQSKKQNVTQKRNLDAINYIGSRKSFLAPTCCTTRGYSDTQLVKSEVECKTNCDPCYQRRGCQPLQCENKATMKCISFCPRECIKESSKANK